MVTACESALIARAATSLLIRRYALSLIEAGEFVLGTCVLLSESDRLAHCMGMI
jgi:hypothetical protein